MKLILISNYSVVDVCAVLLFDCPGDIDVETPYLDARIFNARAESASYIDDTLSSVRRSVMFLADCMHIVSSMLSLLTVNRRPALDLAVIQNRLLS